MPNETAYLRTAEKAEQDRLDRDEAQKIVEMLKTWLSMRPAGITLTELEKVLGELAGRARFEREAIYGSK